MKSLFLLMKAEKFIKGGDIVKKIPDYLQFYYAVKKLAEEAKKNLPENHPTRKEAETLFSLLDPVFLRQLTQRRLAQLTSPFSEFPRDSLKELYLKEKGLVELLKQKFPEATRKVSPPSFDRLITKIVRAIGRELKKALQKASFRTGRLSDI